MRTAILLLLSLSLASSSMSKPKEEHKSKSSYNFDQKEGTLTVSQTVLSKCMPNRNDPSEMKLCASLLGDVKSFYEPALSLANRVKKSIEELKKGRNEKLLGDLFKTASQELKLGDEEKIRESFKAAMAGATSPANEQQLFNSYIDSLELAFKNVFTGAMTNPTIQKAYEKVGFTSDRNVTTERFNDESKEYVEATGVIEDGGVSKTWYHLGTGKFGDKYEPSDAKVAIVDAEIRQESLYWLRNLGLVKFNDYNDAAKRYLLFILAWDKQKKTDLYRFLLYSAQSRSTLLEATERKISKEDKKEYNLREAYVQAILNLVEKVNAEFKGVERVHTELWLRLMPFKNLSALSEFLHDHFAVALASLKTRPVISSSTSSSLASSSTTAAPTTMSTSLSKSSPSSTSQVSTTVATTKSESVIKGKAEPKAKPKVEPKAKPKVVSKKPEERNARVNDEFVKESQENLRKEYEARKKKMEDDEKEREKNEELRKLANQQSTAGPLKLKSDKTASSVASGSGRKSKTVTLSSKQKNKKKNKSKNKSKQIGGQSSNSKPSKTKKSSKAGVSQKTLLKQKKESALTAVMTRQIDPPKKSSLNTVLLDKVNDLLKKDWQRERFYNMASLAQSVESVLADWGLEIVDDKVIIKDNELFEQKCSTKLVDLVVEVEKEDSEKGEKVQKAKKEDNKPSLETATTKSGKTRFKGKKIDFDTFNVVYAPREIEEEEAPPAETQPSSSNESEQIDQDRVE